LLFDVGVPSIHEPGSPLKYSLELINVPGKSWANKLFHIDNILDRDGVVGGLSKWFDMRRVNLFKLCSNMQACYSQQLKLMSLYNLIAMDNKVVKNLHWNMKCLPFETVIRRNLAHPVNKSYSHVLTYFFLIVTQSLFNFNSLLYFLLFLKHILKYIKLLLKFWEIIFFDLIINLII